MEKKYIIFSQVVGILSATACLVTFVSCQSSDLQKNIIAETEAQKSLLKHAPRGYTPPKATRLDHKGQNRHGVFASDGQRYAFVSQNRDQHKNSQVYIADLNSGKSKRITFHDGVNSQVEFFPGSQNLIYSSSTDEIKENIDRLLGLLDLTQKVSYPLLPPDHNLNSNLEIYLSSRNGNSIERLTQSYGYDSSFTVHPKGSHLVYTSVKNKTTQLYRLDLKTRRREAIVATSHFDLDPHYSPKGNQLAWVRYSKDLKFSRLLIASSNGLRSRVVFSRQAFNTSPVWHPKGSHLIFSSNLDDEKNYELYAIKTDGTCLQRLTYQKSNERHPHISNDGKKLMFTSDRGGQSQLYIMDYQPPERCPETTS